MKGSGPGWGKRAGWDQRNICDTPWENKMTQASSNDMAWGKDVAWAVGEKKVD